MKIPSVSTSEILCSSFCSVCLSLSVCVSIADLLIVLVPLGIQLVTCLDCQQACLTLLIRMEQYISVSTLIGQYISVSTLIGRYISVSTPIGRYINVLTLIGQYTSVSTLIGWQTRAVCDTGVGTEGI